MGLGEPTGRLILELLDGASCLRELSLFGGGCHWERHDHDAPDQNASQMRSTLALSSPVITSQGYLPIGRQMAIRDLGCDKRPME